MAKAFSLVLVAIVALAVAPAGAPDAAALSGKLDAIFGAPIFSDAGIVVIDDSGRRLYDRNADTPLIPASTQKVLTAAAALDRLGPAFRAVTRLSALAAPVDGKLEGPLWLVGGGDPYLTRDDLRNGIAALAATGVREIDGPLLVDDSLFEGPEANPHWDPDDVAGGFAAPLSSVTLDQGTVEVHVSGTSPGDPAGITFLPATRAITIAGRPTTVNGASNSVDFIPSAQDGGRAFAITGSVSPGNIAKVWIPVHDPSLYIGDVAATMLRDKGIALRGAVGKGVAPLVGVTLWEHPSPALHSMLKETLTHSNNHAADTLLRLVGSTDGRPGTDERGVAAVLAVLSKAGIDVSSFRLYDGSGLSAANRVPPVALAQAIAAQTKTANASAFLAALPLVGREGTVRERDVHDSLGRARAKTGHLRGVDSLAGTVLSRHHGRLSFAFIKNGSDAWADEVETAQDDALEALADF